MSLKGKDLAPLLLLALIWGSYYVASQSAVGVMSVFSVGVLIRLLTLVLLTVRMGCKRELSALLQVRGILPKLILIGVLGFLLDFTAFLGLTFSSAGAGTALLKTDILFVALISMVVYRQKFSWREWACTLVMLFGVLLVMNLQLWPFSLGGKGSVFFLLSALFVSINAFVIKSVQRDPKFAVSNDVIAYYNNFVTLILFTAASLGMGTLGQLRMFGRNPFVTVALLLAALGQTGIYIVYYYNLKRFPVWLVKVVLLLMPVVSALVSFVLFGDRLTTRQILGIAVVMLGALGILLEQRKKDQQKLGSSM